MNKECNEQNSLIIKALFDNSCASGDDDTLPELKPREVVLTKGGTTWEEPIGFLTPMPSTTRAKLPKDEDGGSKTTRAKQTKTINDAESSLPTKAIEIKPTRNNPESSTLDMKTDATASTSVPDAPPSKGENKGDEEEGEEGDSGLPLALIIGLGIGIPLGIIVIVAIIVSFWRATWRDKSPQSPALGKWYPNHRHPARPKADMDGYFEAPGSTPPGYSYGYPGYGPYGPWQDSRWRQSSGY